jgi:hypothetical protein
LYFFIGIPASLQSEFSLTPAGTKTPGQLTELVMLKTAEEPEIPEDILAFIKDAEAGRISTFELRKKYTSDSRFREAYDLYVSTEQQSAPITLTALEYRSMPSAVTLAFLHELINGLRLWCRATLLFRIDKRQVHHRAIPLAAMNRGGK